VDLEREEEIETTMGGDEKIPRLLFKRLGFHLIGASVVGTFFGWLYWRRNIRWEADVMDYYEKFAKLEEDRKREEDRLRPGTTLLQQNKNDSW